MDLERAKGRRKEEEEEENREEEGMYVYHNETAIVDEKPSPFFQFTDQEV